MQLTKRVPASPKITAFAAVTVCLLLFGAVAVMEPRAQTPPAPKWTASKPVPMLKDYGLKEYVRLSKDLLHVENAPWKLVCEMPYNCQFQPWIEVESVGGGLIKFNSSNPLVLYLTPTETWTTDAGTRAYGAKNWISGEGAIYTIPAGVTVKAAKYHETGYNTEIAGSFECNDEDYNTTTLS